MKKYYYILGLSLLILGCLSGIILDALTFVVAIAGAILILISSQKIWVKLLTVILLQPIVIYETIFVLFANY